MSNREDNFYTEMFFIAIIAGIGLSIKIFPHIPGLIKRIIFAPMYIGQHFRDKKLYKKSDYKDVILQSVKQYSKYQYSNKIKYKINEINKTLEKISKSTITPMFNEVEIEKTEKIKEIINKTEEINNNERRILNKKKLITFKKELQYLNFSEEEIKKQIEKSVPGVDQIAQIKKWLEQKNVINNDKVTEEIIKYKNLTKLDKQIIKLLENKENKYTIKQLFKEIKDIPKQKKDYTNLITSDYFTLKLYKKQNIYKINELTEYQKERISILKLNKMVEIKTIKDKEEIEIIITKDLENKLKEPKYIFSKDEKDLAIEYFKEENVKIENFRMNFVGKNKDYNYKNFKNKIENITSYLRKENKDIGYVLNQFYEETNEETNEEYGYFNNRINYLKDINILTKSEKLELNEGSLEKITEMKLSKLKNKNLNYQEQLSELEQDFINYIDKGNGKIEINEFINQQKNYINYLNKKTEIDGADQKSEYMKYCEIKSDNISKKTLETIVKLNAITDAESEVEIKKIMNGYAEKVSITNIKITEKDIEAIYLATQKTIEYLKETNQKIIISKKEFELLKKQFNELSNIKYSDIYDYSKLFKNNLYNESLNASIIAGKKEEKRIENLAKKLDQEQSNNVKIVAGFDKVDILGF